MIDTDDLIELIATGLAPANRSPIPRHFGVTLPLGFAGALLLTWIVFGWRHDLALAAHAALFWIKLAFPLAIAVAACLLVQRLGRPGARGVYRWWLLAAPFAAVWIGAASVLIAAAPDARLPMLLGQSWRSCPFISCCCRCRASSPCSGPCAGSPPPGQGWPAPCPGCWQARSRRSPTAAYCPEMSPAFWGVWYVAGLLLPAAIGALAGPRLLRW
ncbi:MAG: putative anti-sigma-F factor NrsF [Burkholderia gladioli]|nr:MAG: putative anti-sigma-F factor NrsF [Burkholderia gladioli]